MDKLCAKCNEPIPAGKRADARYCSTRCKKSVEYRKYYKPTGPTKRLYASCRACKGPIPGTKKLDAVYCSRACKVRINRKDHNANREGLRRGNAGYLPFKDAEWEKLKRRFMYCCAYCGHKKRLEMDHVIPLSRGGRHAIANILPCCRQCNMKKKDKLLAEWRHGR